MAYQESILQKIKDGVYELSQKRKGRSEIWNVYAQIKTEDGSILGGYLCCRKCLRLYKFDGKRTSNLNRHKCFISASQDADITNNDEIANENDLDEDVKECEDFFSIFTRGDPQIREASSHQPSVCNSDTNADIKSTENQGTPKIALTHTKQLNSLCEMIKVDLQDVSDEIFFEAKWKILDVLREVHRKKLTADFK